MDVNAALESELAWVAQHRAPGPDLDFDLREAARTVLQRHGLRALRIAVRSSATGIDVDITFPPTVPRIRQVRLRLR